MGQGADMTVEEWAMDEYPTAHARGRRISDEVLRRMSAEELHILAEQCAIEPADPSDCDACAAYLMAGERDREDARLANEFVLGATDALSASRRSPASAQHQPRPLEDWMARALVAEASRAELVQELANERARNIAAAMRPWRFVPGDRVVVLYGNRVLGGVVTEVRLPGPIHAERCVQVAVDEGPDGLVKVWWWDPDQVEPLGR